MRVPKLVLGVGAEWGEIEVRRRKWEVMEGDDQVRIRQPGVAARIVLRRLKQGVFSRIE